MASAQNPPLSIRPGEERLARIDAFGKKRGVKRHAAALLLIDAGLKANGPSLPEPTEQARMKAPIGAIQATQAKTTHSSQTVRIASAPGRFVDPAAKRDTWNPAFGRKK